eukprot:11913091-Alexandrium_andersonii.AAC.1
MRQSATRAEPWCSLTAEPRSPIALAAPSRSTRKMPWAPSVVASPAKEATWPPIAPGRSSW